MRADFVEDADVRMIQAGDGVGFAVEPLAGFRVIGEMRSEDFQVLGALRQD